MKTLQILGLFVLLAAFSPVALADNYGELKFIGFSENGKYLAYEEFGTIIGNHGQYFTTYFVDTAKNSFVIAPIPFDNKEFTTTSEYRLDQLRYERRVEKNLKRFGIKRGNFGEFAVAHFLNDWSFVKPVEREGIFYEDGNSEPIKKMMPDYAGGFVRKNTAESEKIIFNDLFDTYRQNTNEFFELTLIPTLAKPVEGCAESYKFELTLKNNTRHSDIELQILQKDGDILPASRDCPFGYKIERVYVNDDKIAVFLNVFSKGFESPNMTYLVVTGKIAGR